MEMTQGLIEFNWSSLMILCNVFILYIILRKFFWGRRLVFPVDAVDDLQTLLQQPDRVFDAFRFIQCLDIVH